MSIKLEATHKNPNLCYQWEYVAALQRLATIHEAKCLQYGEKRYDEHLSQEFNCWMCFSDVYRKFIRLEKLIASGTDADLLKCYEDLANYSIMAVQILGRRKCDEI